MSHHHGKTAEPIWPMHTDPPWPMEMGFVIFKFFNKADLGGEVRAGAGLGGAGQERLVKISFFFSKPG